jgi:hypothetical protein
MRVLPGGRARSGWLSKQLARIWTRSEPPQRKLATPRGPASKITTKVRPAERPRNGAPPPAPVSANEVPATPPGLPRIDIEIPFTTELDLAPLAAAMMEGAEPDAGWYQLPERFAHLGLAQGFDELMCLSHLRGIDTFRYQVETVRKVLKQFRGRVLLADEVGLGKTGRPYARLSAQ